MPYPGIPEKYTDKIDRCVQKLLKDKNFKPKNGLTKKQSAIAVCISSIVPENERGKKANEVRSLTKKNMKGNNIIFHSLVNVGKLMEASEGNLPEWIEVMKVGYYVNDVYGEFEITEEDLAKFVANFKAGVRAKGENKEDNTLPINIAHNRDGEAAGWITDLKKEDGKLLAKVEWTELGKEKLQKKLYKYISPEWYMEYVDPETGFRTTNVLVGAALTNIPLFKSLKPLTAAEGNDIIYIRMELKEILNKKPKELTAEEISFLRSKVDELSDEDKEKFASVLKANEEEGNETKENNDEEDKEDKNNEEEEEREDEKEKEGEEGQEENEETELKEGSEEKFVKLTASEYNELLKVKREYRKRKLEERVELLTASENKEGVIYPKYRDEFINILLEMSEDKAEKVLGFFEKVAKEMNKIKLGGERGSGENNEINNKTEMILRLMDEKKKVNPKKTNIEIYRELMKEKPELFE